MKHKVKHFIALMGTVLLGNSPTVGIASSPENSPFNDRNDSFLSKLDMTHQSKSLYQMDFTDEATLFSIPVQNDMSKENERVRVGCSGNLSPASPDFLAMDDIILTKINESQSI